MKRLFPLVFILASLSIVFEGCTKSADVTPSSMTATFVGSTVVWTAQQCTVTPTAIGLNLLGYINTPGYSSFSFQIPFNPAIGTYLISSSGGYTTAFYSQGTTPKSAVHGSISFTSVSPYLTGTFSMVLQDSTGVTSGSFNIKAP